MQIPNLGLKAQLTGKKAQVVRVAPETLQIIYEIRGMIGADKRLGSYQSIVAQAVGCYRDALRKKRICSFCGIDLNSVETGIVRTKSGRLFCSERCGLEMLLSEQEKNK